MKRGRKSGRGRCLRGATVTRLCPAGIARRRGFRQLNKAAVTVRPVTPKPGPVLDRLSFAAPCNRIWSKACPTRNLLPLVQPGLLRNPRKLYRYHQRQANMVTHLQGQTVKRRWSVIYDNYTSLVAPFPYKRGIIVTATAKGSKDYNTSACRTLSSGNACNNK